MARKPPKARKKVVAIDFVLRLSDDYLEVRMREGDVASGPTTSAASMETQPCAAPLVEPCWRTRFDGQLNETTSACYPSEQVLLDLFGGKTEQENKSRRAVVLLAMAFKKRYCATKVMPFSPDDLIGLRECLDIDQHPWTGRNSRDSTLRKVLGVPKSADDILAKKSRAYSYKVAVSIEPDDRDLVMHWLWPGSKPLAGEPARPYLHATWQRGDASLWVPPSAHQVAFVGQNLTTRLDHAGYEDFRTSLLSLLARRNADGSPRLKKMFLLVQDPLELAKVQARATWHMLDETLPALADLATSLGRDAGRITFGVYREPRQSMLAIDWSSDKPAAFVIMKSNTTEIDKRYVHATADEKQYEAAAGWLSTSLDHVEQIALPTAATLLEQKFDKLKREHPVAYADVLAREEEDLREGRRKRTRTSKAALSSRP